jgi:hypothetical protein
LPNFSIALSFGFEAGQSHHPNIHGSEGKRQLPVNKQFQHNSADSLCYVIAKNKNGIAIRKPD